MAEYTPKELEQAKRIVEELVDPEEGVLDVDPSLVISDVQTDAIQFAHDLGILGEMNDEAPAVQVGDDLVPMALSLAMASVWPFYPFPDSLQRFPLPPYYLHGIFSRAQELGAFKTITREQARATFVKRATEFLAVRMAWMRDFNGRAPENRSGIPFLNILQRVGGAMVQTPGCYFTITTNSPGLRAFWSGAYLVSANYFGHPTSPVHSVLQSGTFIFGVDGGAYGNNLKWDRNAKVTLPGNPHVHLNY